jgi:hypothetical protein
MIVCKNQDLQPVFTEYERLSVLSRLVLNAEKTEILNLTESNITSNNIRYLGAGHVLNRLRAIRICGIWHSNDDDTEYESNVKDKIKTMESIVISWKRRFISMQGRMILA